MFRELKHRERERDKKKRDTIGKTIVLRGKTSTHGTVDVQGLC